MGTKLLFGEHNPFPWDVAYFPVIVASVYDWSIEPYCLKLMVAIPISRKKKIGNNF